MPDQFELLSRKKKKRSQFEFVGKFLELYIIVDFQLYQKNLLVD